MEDSGGVARCGELARKQDRWTDLSVFLQQYLIVLAQRNTVDDARHSLKAKETWLIVSSALDPLFRARPLDRARPNSPMDPLLPL